MATSLAPFEVPERLVKDEDTATDTYAKFTAEPFEAGFGHTVGNSLRRVLLSSLEGAAITSVRIAGAQHEFASLPGVVEDVTEIVLNLKQIRFKHFEDKDPATLSLTVDKAGEITAGDIQEIAQYEIVNKDQHICTLDRNTKFNIEMEVRVGRGFNSSEDNKHPDMPIGVIPIDSIFSPVRRVKYAVENTRVGQRTDYDKLVLGITTNGAVRPEDAIGFSSKILKDQLQLFINFDEAPIDAQEVEVNEEQERLVELLSRNVEELELSVRSANCLKSGQIKTLFDLVTKTEQEMLKFRNFGRKSLNEIGEILEGMELSFGMNFDTEIADKVREQAGQ